MSKHKSIGEAYEATNPDYENTIYVKRGRVTLEQGELKHWIERLANRHPIFSMIIGVLEWVWDRYYEERWEEESPTKL